MSLCGIGLLHTCLLQQGHRFLRACPQRESCFWSSLSLCRDSSKEVTGKW